MRVTGIGEDSTRRQIIRLMEDAQLSKAPIQALADRIAGSFALWVLAISLVTFVGWLLALSLGLVPPSWVPPEHRGSPLVLALTLAVSTMVVACPCAMGLATPTAIMVGTGVGAANGVLIKGGEALETAYRLSAVVFDKTGTLTMGQPAVDAFEVLLPPAQAQAQAAAAGVDAARVLWLVASAERGSEHPLAKCIVRYAHSSDRSSSGSGSGGGGGGGGDGKSGGGLRLAEPEEFRAVSGKGLACRVAGEEVAVGTLAWLREVGSELPSAEAQVGVGVGGVCGWVGLGVWFASSALPPARRVCSCGALSL